MHSSRPTATIAARSLAGIAVLLLLVLVPSDPAGAQERAAPLALVTPSGERIALPVEMHRGYAAAPLPALERIGWSVQVRGDRVEARRGEDVTLEFRPGSPFFTWNGELLQLVQAPYFFGERFHVPVQVLTGFLPRRLPQEYAFQADSGTLQVLGEVAWASSAASDVSGTPSQPFVVVIDPGHGGRDTGALGPGGVTEKEVALGVARALARELEDEPGFEVHLTREDDAFVPLWQRGERATEWKGNRPGVFVSLHANAAARSSSRGFETYFLSEARTEHERRVAALENASLQMEDEADGQGAGPDRDLGFILNDLRNRDHQRWSALLAELVQEELVAVHPGPNRGVKQGPFAVITNALMPGVLVELGFLSHAGEAQLMAGETFQRDAARSLAEALRTFFERYPPGAETAHGGSR